MKQHNETAQLGSVVAATAATDILAFKIPAQKKGSVYHLAWAYIN